MMCAMGLVVVEHPVVMMEDIFGIATCRDNKQVWLPQQLPRGRGSNQ